MITASAMPSECPECGTVMRRTADAPAVCPTCGPAPEPSSVAPADPDAARRTVGRAMASAGGAALASAIVAIIGLNHTLDRFTPNRAGAIAVTTAALLILTLPATRSVHRDARRLPIVGWTMLATMLLGATVAVAASAAVRVAGWIEQNDRVTIVVTSATLLLLTLLTVIALRAVRRRAVHFVARFDDPPPPRVVDSAGLACPQCHYALEGMRAVRGTCPECGDAIDLNLLRAAMSTHPTPLFAAIVQRTIAGFIGALLPAMLALAASIFPDSPRVVITPLLGAALVAIWIPALATRTRRRAEFGPSLLAACAGFLYAVSALGAVFVILFLIPAMLSGAFDGVLFVTIPLSIAIALDGAVRIHLSLRRACLRTRPR